ncbi:hypothetical protein CI1B_29670 [Bradyrhizobium ivorense]|uniref:Uncharacterized protein n=1 Tax=Bradyrhizobium ivorense TaxID=2511166 RepID=A0A508T737_9BRAD|nr:hypothetical protein CI1B_29670 [Bradyrhizobium ivorense]
MLNSETAARLRRILDEVCKDLSRHETGIRAHVASKILEAAYRGETSVEVLRQVGQTALSSAPSMWPQQSSRRSSSESRGAGEPNGSTKQD